MFMPTNHTTIPEIVKKYRQEQQLTLREFAEALTTCCGESVTYQTIHNWENGVHKPSKWILVRTLRKCGDWRFDCADECLSVIDPKIWGDISTEMISQKEN
jgi:transcriptional regulator with XRE-family HTH domain